MEPFKPLEDIHYFKRFRADVLAKVYGVEHHQMWVLSHYRVDLILKERTSGKVNEEDERITEGLMIFLCLMD